MRYIKDADGNVLFHEKSLSPKTVRPYYLLNGSESIPLVSKIGQSVDKDLEKNQFVAMIYDGKPMGVHNTFEPSLDGKLVRVYGFFLPFTIYLHTWCSKAIFFKWYRLGQTNWEFLLCIFHNVDIAIFLPL